MVEEEEVERREEKGERGNLDGAFFFFFFGFLFFSSSPPRTGGRQHVLDKHEDGLFGGDLSFFLWWEREKKKVNEKQSKFGLFLLSLLSLSSPPSSLSHLDPLPDDVAKVPHGQVRRDQVPVFFVAENGKKEEESKRNEVRAGEKGRRRK